MTSDLGYQAFAQFAPPIRPFDAARAAIAAATRLTEAESILPLAYAARISTAERAAIAGIAHTLIMALRQGHRPSGVQALVQEFSLSSREGVALMCLAEALLRIPDVDTRDALIRDKIGSGNWTAHLGSNRSLFVNAATWGLALTGKLTATVDDGGLTHALARLIGRLGEPVIRRGVDVAMRMMGEQFVMGQTIAEALENARNREARGYGFSYDMLGEAAATAGDAVRYYAAYEAAIHAIGAAAAGRGPYAGPGISIKLSALYPRYVRAQANRVRTELYPRVLALAQLARAYDIGFNIDAEEADRLDLSLDILQSLAEDVSLSGWNGLGFVAQAYQKRCPAVIAWIIALARRTGRRIMVRLVKGAYWDAEIKRTQVDGLADFPVYTRKVHTDVSYIACAKSLLAARDAVFPQFATHNAQSLATIYALAGPAFTLGDYEFQCLHGMGEPLYDEVVYAHKLNRPCRIYAPVGTHETLLAYLVRRLLENGANASFVNRIADANVDVADLIADPAEEVLTSAQPGARHEKIALPVALFTDRKNARGLDLADTPSLLALGDRLASDTQIAWRAGRPRADQAPVPILNPADHRDVVGHVWVAEPRDAAVAAAHALAAAPGWAATPVATRAACLERAADRMEAAMPRFMGLLMREAGKSAANAVSEVREAVDFLRYYAGQARQMLDGATPIGPVVSISPWNFPLAIFTGQMAAALAAGNPVLAKPSGETPLVAAQAVALLHNAGIPADVLQLLPGDGTIGAALVSAPQIAGVVFTGSTCVAQLIWRQLAGRLSHDGAPLPFIAETGGQNAMIVDSSALTEQVVGDVIASAFDSAGQRCSALRILCVQDDVAERTLTMLTGAMAELRIGSTDQLCADIGPVISAKARDSILAHIQRMRALGHAVHQVPTQGWEAVGTFVPPTLIEITSIAELEAEVFGPVLHVIRYRADGLDALIDQINATGYGLTFGLHTRLDETIARVTAGIAAGNLYVNRTTIGAVVGVQPFGGRGLSGTGPKAGGPLYLTRFVRGIAEPHYHPGESIALPGPVGECNSLTFHPRGHIAVFAQRDEDHAVQIEAVLATGNTPVVGGDPATMANISAALVAGDAPFVADVARALATRGGAIVTLHTPDPVTGLYPHNLLLEEVTLSVNSTAAGGNASLMAMV